MKKRIPVLILILAVAAAVWVVKKRSEFRYAGTLEATEVDLAPQVSGIISTVHVNQGESVKKGDVLIEIAGQDIKLAADIAESDFKRAQALRKSGSIPEESYDKIRYKRDDAVLRASWCTITSPINGTVLERYHEPGEFATPGLKILTVADLSEVWAYIYVPEQVLSKIQLNQKLKAVINDDDSQTAEGTVVFIREKAEFTPKNVQTRDERTRLVFGVKVQFPNAELHLKPGMSIEVELPK